MSNPYEILNIKKGATKDEVRRAYKKLAKQYHPDQYDDNPLKDLAEERMREVNEAYDSLMKTFDSGSSSSSQSYNSNKSSYNNSSSNYNNSRNSYGQRQSNYGQQSNQSSSYQYNNNNNNYAGDYNAIRNDIYSGNLRSAEQKLNTVKTRDAEWNYLMGILYNKKGWHDSANRYLNTAVRMNPDHPEYRNALNQTNYSTNSYRQNYYGRRSGGNDMFDLCFKLWCADSLCECAGGDLIDCM